MADPWAVVSTKPASMPPSMATAKDPWEVVSHQPADDYDPSLTRMMGNGMPTQEDMQPSDDQHPVVAHALSRAGGIVKGMFDTVAKPPEGAAENISMIAGPAGPIATRLIRGQVQAEKQLAPQLSEQIKAAQASHSGQKPVTAEDIFSNPVSAANNAGPTLEDLRAANTALAMANPFASGSVANINQLHDEGKPQQALGEGITDALALGSGLPGPAKAIGGVVSDSARAFRGVTADNFVPNMKAKAVAVGKVAADDFGRIPVIGKLGKYYDAVKAKADPQLTLFNSTPKLGDSPLFSTADQPSLQSGNVRSTPMPPEPAPAPYRLKGDQITDATTVKARRVLGPDRQLQAAPEDVIAKPMRGVTQPPEPPTPAPPETAPKAARGITQGKAPYVPGAQMEPAPFLTMHGAETGETAALMQLSHTGGQALRRIATARGLKIPAAADNVSIIQKIHADMSPEEIQSFADAAKARAQERATSLEGVDPAIVADNKAIAQKLYSKADEMQAAGESPYKIRAWRTAGESIETRPTPVKDILGDTDALRTIRGVDSRMAQHIQEVTAAPSQLPAPQRGFTQAPPQPEAPKPQLATEANTEDLLQKSLDMQNAKRGITQQQPEAQPPNRTVQQQGPEESFLRANGSTFTPGADDMFQARRELGKGASSEDVVRRAREITLERVREKERGTSIGEPQILPPDDSADWNFDPTEPSRNIPETIDGITPKGELPPPGKQETSANANKAQRGITQGSPPGPPSVSTTPPAGGFSSGQFTIGKGEPLPHAPDVAKHPIFDAKGNRVGHLQISVRPDGTGDIGWLGPDDRANGQPLDIGADSMRGIVNQLRQQYPDLTGKIGGKATFARQQAREARRTAARGITQPIDLNAPQGQRVMPPEVTARATPEQLPNTPGNSPVEAQSFLEQASQNLFGKSFAQLTDAERAKTYSEGAKLQDAARKKNRVPISMRGITAPPSFRGITSDNFSNA